MLPIALEEVTKVYNPGLPDEVSVLRGVSLRIEAGEVVVLQGPSGSGKTTLLGIIGCMTRPTAGRVWVGDQNVAKLPERFLVEQRRSTFGFIFQQLHLIPELSALENVMVPLYPTGLGLAEMREQAAAALVELGLGQRLNTKPRHLSGGEQQRVAVARALVNDPRIVIADEPTAHLDGALAAQLLERLEAIREQGRSVIIATHDPRVSGHPFVDRVVDLRDGEVAGIRTR
jgi:putative ABC transport system ATP-binding protein